MMTRSIITIPKDVLQKLDRIAKNRHESRSALIREAIESWLKNYKKTASSDNVFGLWRDREDAVTLQKKLRDEW